MGSHFARGGLPHADLRATIGKMSESQDYTPVPPEIPEGRNGGARQVAIVGLNRETANLLPSLLDADGIQVIKVLNPDFEELGRLTSYPHLDVIIDTTRNPSIAARLRKLPLKKVDVLSGLGARLLFCSIRDGRAEGKDGVARSLEEIRDAVGLAKDKRAMLQVILNTAVKTARADSGSLMLLDPSRRQLTIEAACGLDERVVASSIQRVGHGVSGYVVRRCEPVLINGAVDREAYAADYQKTDIVSSICCPLAVDGEALGVINIASKHPDRVFDSVDVEYLEEIASVAAEVIKTARADDPAAHAGQALGLLNQVRAILAMQYRFEERLNLMLMKMANAFGAKACTYYSFSPAERCFVARASSSVGAALLKERPMLLDDFFAQRVLKAPNTFCVNSAGKGPRDKKWYMLQPILAGAELAGVLFVYLHSERNQFREEMAILKRIGDLLAREVAKHRELESIKAQSLKHSAIAQFASDAARASSLDELTKMILSNLRLIVDAGTCVLRLRDPDSEGFPVAATESRRNPVWMKGILEVDRKIAEGLATGGTLKIDKLAEAGYGSDLEAAESALGTALEIEGEAAGTLALYDKRSLDPGTTSRAFSDEDKDVLEQFAGQAAKALARFFPFPSRSPAPQEPALADP
jgi:GAF domain-containing protein